MASLKVQLERVRFWALAAGCASLFWQWDLAAADVFFGVGILLSLALWERGEPLFDLAWPQPLLFLFLSISALVTTFQSGGSSHFLLITCYLAAVSLALASALRRDPRRIRTVEKALVFAGILTAAMVTLGAWAAAKERLPLLDIFAYDYLRGMGLFKDPNVAGAFLACTYPLAATWCLRLRRGRTVLLLLLTAAFATGVALSYSRWALVVLGLGVVGTIGMLAISRDRRPLVALGTVVIVAVLVAMQLLPSWRYQAKQGYDDTGRLAAWRLALDLAVERPLGTGAGSFETYAVERYGPASGWTLVRAPGSDPGRAAVQSAPASVNLARNGAFDGPINWTLGLTAAVVEDVTSPTGHALRKITTDKYQDPAMYIPIEAGQMYSFASAIRTDGTPAALIIHWRDANDFTIAQANSEPVSAPTWTESRLEAQVAPADARAALVLLSNFEPGTQYFTALRAVVGPVVPPWSPELQHIDWAEAGDSGVPVPTSTHNTYLRLIAENGVLGFVTLCTYWIVLAWSLLRMGRRAHPWALAFVLMLVSGLTIDSLHWRELWVYAAFAAALLVDAPSRVRATIPTGVLARA